MEWLCQLEWRTTRERGESETDLKFEAMGEKSVLLLWVGLE
jgi:hypothetical protein